MALNNSGGMQLSYSNVLTGLLPGMLAYGLSGVESIFTYILAAGLSSLNFGLGVVRDSDGGVRLPRPDIGVVTFAGAFVASNVINLKVNGTAISPVTYNTNTDTTLGLVATAIEAIDGVASTDVDTSARSITVNMDSGESVAITDIVVTLGASQTTGSASYASTDTYLGQPVYDPMRVSGDGFRLDFDLGVATHTMGIVVKLSHNVTKGDKAYVELQDATKLGQYTNVAGGNLPTYGTFNSDGLSGGSAILILNLPQGA